MRFESVVASTRLYRAFVVALWLWSPVSLLAAGGHPEEPSTAPIQFSADRATGMSIDVAPDGRSILFDMLGDIYVLPIAGGRARRLTNGAAWDAFPRYSPDGKSIAFISDRNGLENLWVMSRTGGGGRLVSRNQDVLNLDVPFYMRGPAWAPDGQSIAVRRKRQRSPYSRDELWSYRIGSGVGTPLIGRGHVVNVLTSPTGAAFAKDGGGLVASSYDPWDRSSSATRLDLIDNATGKRTSLVESTSLLSSPAISPDGLTLAYLATQQDGDGFGQTDVRTCTLVLAAGAQKCAADRLLTANVGTMRRASAAWWTWPQGLAFTPNGRSLILVRYGKLEQFDLKTGGARPIPFEVDVDITPTQRNQAPIPLHDGPMPVRQLSGMQADRRGKLVVFGALGDVWTQTEEKDPHRLIGGPAFRFDPVLSPDGEWIAYVAWSDTDGGSIWKQPAAGGKAIKVADGPTRHFVPQWTRDGRQLIYLRDVDGDRRAQQLMIVSADGGPANPVASAAALSLGAGAYSPSPQLSTSGDGHWAYLVEARSPASRNDPESVIFPRWRLLRIPLAGGKPEPLVDLYGLGVQVRPSPDGRWLAIQHGYNLYLRAMPDLRSISSSNDAAPIRIDLTGSEPDRALVRITTEGGVDPVWSPDSRTLSWSWMTQLHRAAVADLIRGRKPTRSWSIDLTVPQLFPHRDLLLTGARVITMATRGVSRTVGPAGAISSTTDPGVIECGDILISGRRIAKIARCGKIRRTGQTERIDLSGKTLMPGLIAMHEHRNFYHIPDEQPRSLSLMLAHGFTTVRDPGQGYEALHTQELVEAGRLIGPRWFGSLIYLFGPDFYPSGEEIGSAREALSMVRKFKSAGATILKDYFKPHRIQRQWLTAAARAEGIRITSDQGFEWDRNMTQALDGYSGFEHTLNTCDVGPDVVGVLGRLGTTYAPQLALDATRAREATAWLAAHPRSWWQSGQPDEFDREVKGNSSAVCRAVVARDFLRAGVNVVSGRDVGLTGLEQHVALWGFAAGGMTNAEILRVGTINGARGLGVEKELGSLEVGKIADILVLDADPLETIFNTLSIRQVVKDGIVYDGDTLAVVSARGGR